MFFLCLRTVSSGVHIVDVQISLSLHMAVINATGCLFLQIQIQRTGLHSTCVVVCRCCVNQNRVGGLSGRRSATVIMWRSVSLAWPLVVAAVPRQRVSDYRVWQIWCVIVQCISRKRDVFSETAVLLGAMVAVEHPLFHAAQDVPRWCGPVRFGFARIRDGFRVFRMQFSLRFTSRVFAAISRCVYVLNLLWRCFVSVRVGVAP